MADIPEGTVRQHPNGGTYIRQGGVWVLQGQAAAAPATTGVLGTIPGRVDPYKARDQQLQEEAAARAVEDQRFQREKFEREMAKADAPPKDPKVTEGERGAAGYYRRAVNAHRLYGEGILPRGPVAQSAVDMLPQSWKGAVSSPERRAAENYADEFIRAKLRKESGASIPPEEMAQEYRVYFPVPGDTEADLQRKAALREEAIEGLRIAAGGEAGTALEGLKTPEAAPEQITAPPAHIYEDAPQGRELSNGGTQTVDDPTLAGVNAKINEMLKSGAPIRDVAKYVESVGIPLREVMPSLQKIAAWRKRNPGYQGNYSVNVDDKLVPMSGFRSAIADAANSPVGAALVSSADVVSGGHLDNAVGLTGGNAELANAGIEALREQNPGYSLVGDVAGGVGLYASGRGALALAGRSAAPATATFAPRAIAGDAALGGYIGSGSEGTDVFSPQNALLGAVGGAAGGVVGRGAVNTAARAVSPSGGGLAPAYAEGVHPTIGQRMGGVFDRVEQAFASVPLAGGVQRGARNQAVREWQAGAFNKALREIGDQLPKGVQTGTPAHAYMQRSFNKAYDKARSGLTFRQDPEFNKEFTDLVTNEVAGLGSDGQRIFKSIVDRGANLIRTRGGTLAGNDYKNLVSRIEAKVRALRKNPSGDTELADALEGLSILLDKGARRHSTPEAVAAIDAADRGYVSAVLIEEASRKAGTEMGEFTGKQLESAIRANSGRRSRQALRGEAPLQDYAAAGVRLGNNVPDSGTPERLAALGAVGGVAKLIDPIALTPWLANTLANLPGGKQAVNVLLAPNRRALDPARRKLMERAHLGGLLTAAPSAGSVSD